MYKRQVLLYRGGEMPLEEYLTMGYDRDLLLGVRVPLDGIASAAYESARNSETDLPVLTCAAARRPEGFFLAVGAVSYTHLDVYKRQMQD